MNQDTSRHRFFTENLLAWFAQNHRPLPWKGERDPYKIWLSEIILQQTRVEQGLPYFQKFVAQYPTVRDLADAPEDELMKTWQGLGYYSRARNLYATAKFVAHELNGRFPETFDGLRQLKGVGDYTAAAIASFAFGLPHAVLDGNVYRVLARFFGIETPTDSPAAKKEFAQLANQLLDPTRPGDFNQAIMDFGATHCTPQQPKCVACPLRPECAAHLYNKVSELPVRARRLEKKERFFLYVVFNRGEDTFIQKRMGRDIWQDLYEFPIVELPALPTESAEIVGLISNKFFDGKVGGFEVLRVSKPYKQVLTHQIVKAIFCEIDLKDKGLETHSMGFPTANYIQTNRIQLKKMYAVPRIIDSYLHEEVLLLSLF